MKGYFQSMAAEKKIGKKKRLIVKNVKKEDTEVCESTPEVIPLDVHKCKQNLVLTFILFVPFRP